MELPETQVGISEVYSKQSGKGTINIQKVGDTLKFDIRGYDTPKAPIKKQLYLGISKGDENFINIAGGKFENLKISKDIYFNPETKLVNIENRATATGKINEYGKLRIIETKPYYTNIQNAPMDYELFDIVPTNSLKANVPEYKAETTLGKFFNNEIPSTQIKPQITELQLKTTNALQGKTQNLMENIVEESKVSQYFGKGIYERQSYSENILPQKVKVTSNVQIGNNMFKDMSGQGSIKSLELKGKYINLGTQNTKFDSLDKVKPISINFNAQKPEELAKQRPRLNQNQPSLLKQELIQKQKTEQIVTPVYPTPTLGGEYNIEVKPPVIIKVPKPKQQIMDIVKSIKNKKLSKSYNVLRRNKGKIEIVGKNLPLGKATKLGVEKSKSSLSQTFALKESGFTNEPDISYKVPERLFTTPKLKRTNIAGQTFVERRGKTLTERKEVSDILKTKRRKQFLI